MQTARALYVGGVWDAAQYEYELALNAAHRQRLQPGAIVDACGRPPMAVT